MTMHSALLFCRHWSEWNLQSTMPVANEFRASWRSALALMRNTPPTGLFYGRGIVMTFGSASVHAAITSLRLLREKYNSALPVEVRTVQLSCVSLAAAVTFFVAYAQVWYIKDELSANDRARLEEIPLVRCREFMKEAKRGAVPLYVRCYTGRIRLCRCVGWI